MAHTRLVLDGVPVPAKEQILIVDDEDGLRRLMRRVLATQGYPCLEARDAVEARALLAGEEPIALVLCDVSLPGESGLELVRDVLEQHEAIAVVMVTGLDDPALAEAALALGAYGYVLKPFTTNELVIDVANALRRRTLEQGARRHREDLETTLLERTSDLRRLVAQQRVISELGQRALYGLELPMLYDEALRVTLEQLEADAGFVLERLTDRPAMLVIAHAGTTRDVLSVTVEVEPGTDVVQGLKGSGRLSTHRDWGPDSVLCAARELCEERLTAGLAVPISIGQGAFGALTVYRHKRDAFSPEDLTFAGAVANVLGSAIGRKRMERQMSHQALHDPLTGLPNRSLLADRLERLLARGPRRNDHTALLFIDLDHFKRVNDSLGHRAGDELLVAVAGRLSAMARPGDTIARFGGDEFVVLCENLPRPEAVIGIADRIAAALDEPFQIAGAEALFITASVGIALTSGKRTTAEALTRDADAAMYRAKEQGRARYQLFDADLRRQVVKRMRNETAIRWALTREELRVHYQPVVELASGQVVGFEALVRWEHPERGLLGAERLIPYAEDSGLIVAIGDFVLDAACRQLAEWDALDPRHRVWISVNVATRQLGDHGFLDRLERYLALAGPAADRLHLELTEAVLIAEGTSSARRIAEIDQLGVRLVLDDFGTGFSALSYIQRFPLDAIKIDRSFICHLTEDHTQRALVGGIVNIAHALGLTIVAEGVETAGQAEIARDLGCELAQGFLFGHPDTADAAAGLIARETASSSRHASG